MRRTGATDCLGDIHRYWSHPISRLAGRGDARQRSARIVGYSEVFRWPLETANAPFRYKPSPMPSE